MASGWLAVLAAFLLDARTVLFEAQGSILMPLAFSILGYLACVVAMTLMYVSFRRDTAWLFYSATILFGAGNVVGAVFLQQYLQGVY